MDEMEIKLPKLGESIVKATVVAVYKKVGDFIKKDETLMEVSTDKVNSEIPSPYEGKITKILVRANEDVEVGQVLAAVSTNGEKKTGEEKTSIKQEEITSKDKSKLYSPTVLRLAKEKNISFDEIEKIKGSGEGGRVTKKDIENFTKIDLKGAKLIPLSPIRKKIAQSMTKSLEVPHAYLVDQIDVTDLMHFISVNKKSFFDKHSAKLTITAFAAKAIGIASKKYPLTNSSFKGDNILVHEKINLGLAVNVEDNVVVPIIHEIDKLDIVDISKVINELASKARFNKLTNEDIKDGTLTLSNFGMTNVILGYPIIKYPESSIIAMGAITKQARQSQKKDLIDFRSILMLTLGFDHRIYDGIYGCKFINEIKGYLEHGFEKSF
ncbi:MAG: 2-oxo acid dehydrogenase subunit E2 [Parachlamydiales bacterium]|nr:2-oxo acid dehydrogenase subunit E2 [Parachlamydiales bacterium]